MHLTERTFKKEKGKHCFVSPCQKHLHHDKGTAGLSRLFLHPSASFMQGIMVHYAQQERHQLEWDDSWGVHLCGPDIFSDSVDLSWKIWRIIDCYGSMRNKVWMFYLFWFCLFVCFKSGNEPSIPFDHYRRLFTLIFPAIERFLH